MTPRRAEEPIRLIDALPTLPQEEMLAWAAAQRGEEPPLVSMPCPDPRCEAGRVACECCHAASRLARDCQHGNLCRTCKGTTRYVRRARMHSADAYRHRRTPGW